MKNIRESQLTVVLCHIIIRIIFSHYYITRDVLIKTFIAYVVFQSTSSYEASHIFSAHITGYCADAQDAA